MEKEIKIDIFELVKRVYTKRKRRYIIFIPLVFVLASAYILCLPRYYKTQVKLIPEVSSAGGMSLPGNLASLAGMAGIKVGGSSEDAINPDIYPDIFNSTTFLVDLSTIKVTPEKKPEQTYYDYLAKGQDAPWWGAVIQQMMNLFKTSDSTNLDKIDPFYLTKDQETVLISIKESLNCTIDKKTGMITLTTQAQDARVSALLADSIMAKLQAYIIEYRTKKVKGDLAYMQQVYDEARLAYLKAQSKYASFSDSNQDLILSRYKMKQDELQQEMDLSYTVYSQMSQQLQLAKARLQERTPAFTVIQTAVVPLKPAGPKRMAFVAAMVFLTFLFLTCRYTYIEIKEYVR